MANSLLDFVMSVVRDSDAAAAYATNPAQAIADANLVDVTSADVNNLIPVVTESLSSSSWSAATPAGSSEGVDALGSYAGDAVHNVWASGAATEAFDAFDDHLPTQADGVVDLPSGVAIDDHVIDDYLTSDDLIDDVDGPSFATDPSPLGQDAPTFEDMPTVGEVGEHHADVAPLDAPLDQPHEPDFDIFT